MEATDMPILPNEIELQQPFEAEESIGDLKEVVEDKLEFFLQTVSNLDAKYKEIMQPENDSQIITRSLSRLVNILKTVKLHFSFIAAILKCESSSKMPLVKKQFEDISSRYSTLVKASDVNLICTNEAFDTVLEDMFGDLERLTETFFVAKCCHMKEIKKDKENMGQVQVFASKLETIMEYFPAIVTMPQDNLFTQPKSSKAWERLYEDTQFKHFTNNDAVQSSIKKFCSMINVAVAVLHKSTRFQEEKVQSKTMGDIVGALCSPYYFLNQEKAETRAHVFFADPQMDNAFQVWNLPDQKLVKEYFALRLPSIGYDNVIYVPRLFSQITKESVLKEYEDGTLHTIKQSSMEIPDLQDQKEEILKTLFNEDKERVKVRIISPWPLVIQGTKTEKVKSMVSNMKNKLNIFSSNKSNIPENCNGVIIHIHGGGFVSLSSYSHRNYLYRWAKSLNMIIFSIDYRLAPECSYPGPLDDVWQAYNWIMNYSETVLGIPMNKVMLAGDSAGGTLSMSVMMKAIKENARLPDGCLLSYPALNLDPNTFVPSYFKALDDIFLPHKMLKLCLKAYIPDEFRADIDPFLSPIIASDELLSKLPSMRIITGTRDPLHDDSWKLLQRLQNLEKDVKMTVFEDMPHAFLNFDDIIGYDLLIDETAESLRELVDTA